MTTREISKRNIALAIDEADWGPAMKALPSDQWRSFVLALFAVKPGHGQYAEAARMAGYGKTNKNDNALRVQAHRMAHDPRTQAAIREEGAKRLQGSSPAAISALLSLVENGSHKDHIRAIAMLLDRTQPIETKHVVEVTHTNKNADAEALEQLQALRALGTSPQKLLEIFGPGGTDRLQRLEERAAAPIVDAEYSEITDRDGTEGLEDLLK